jgi:hypothetical protein
VRDDLADVDHNQGSVMVVAMIASMIAMVAMVAVV